MLDTRVSSGSTQGQGQALHVRARKLVQHRPLWLFQECEEAFVRGELADTAAANGLPG